MVECETLNKRAISRTASPASRRAIASRLWCTVNFGRRPSTTPLPLARALPSEVRDLMSSRSNSARPPRSDEGFDYPEMAEACHEALKTLCEMGRDLYAKGPQEMAIVMREAE